MPHDDLEEGLTTMRTPSTNCKSPFHRASRAQWAIAALCVAVLALPAAAQNQKTKPKAGCGGGETPAVWQGDASADSPDAAKPVGPRWVLESPSVVLEPLWRGEQIACSFKIKNGGDADLKIQARGG
jgi:hypothetical protein